MQKKTIHIVFQVLNFLSDPVLSFSFQLTADEKLLLLFLAKHKGHKGIYPSLQTLAKELHVHYRNVRRTLDRLKKKKLVIVDYVPGKSSNYILMIPLTQGVDAPTPDQPSETPRASTPSHPGRTRPDTQGVHAPQSDKRNNRVNKTERARKRAPLSAFWKPSEQNMIKCHEIANKVGKSTDDLITKFKNLQWRKEATSAYWDGDFENFLIDERAPAIMGDTRATPKDQPRPQLRDWTAERLAREAKEASQPKAQEAQEPVQPFECITPKEAIARLRLLRQGALSNGEDKTTHPADPGDHHSR
jgi:hypothetical protein